MTIVILHGLYMHGVVMMPLSQRLEALGYKTRIVSYNTLSINLDAVFKEIDNALDEEDNILLGHSLGGLMIKHYLKSRKPSVEKVSHVIVLASPIKGASIAEKLQDMGLGIILGNSAKHGLELHEDEWEFPQLLGCITGSIPVGVRPLLFKDKQSSDGTVTVAETKIQGMTDHVETNNSHTSILFSQQAIDEIDHFIRCSQFSSSVET